MIIIVESAGLLIRRVSDFQSFSMRGTLESTSAAILAGSAPATGYDSDHRTEPSATANIFTVRLCAGDGSSTAP